MNCMIKAVLSNPWHPECEQITIPFPIPDDQYDQVIEMLQAMDLGHVANQDCMVDAVDSRFHVLHSLEGTPVNVDQLDYLAKRLDSFCASEDSQFQAMACHLKLTDIVDLINLTFCCQQATVITDFSDLEAAGRSHFLNMNGGSVRTEELEGLDGVETAWLLIDSRSGVVTPYGVVYDNAMRLEQVYNGRQFPEYLYDESLMVLEVMPRQGPAEGENPEYLYLPASECQLERALLRAGITSLLSIQVHLDSKELPEEVVEALDLEHLSGIQIPALNRMCQTIASLEEPDQEKLREMVCMAKSVCDPSAETALQRNSPAPITLTLTSAESWYYLTLPAYEGKLANTKRDLGVECFDQAVIASVKYEVPRLERLIPADGLTVEDANALALCLQEMEQEDGGLMKFFAVLAAERPDTFAEVLNIAMDRDDYELVPENMEEYGKQLLRRIGADDEVIDTIDGYMNFAQLGADSLEEDGVRQTEFGLVQRLSSPFPPEPEIGPVML